MKQETRHSHFTARQHLLAAAVAACFVVEAQALPVAPTVANGTAGFATSGNTLTVTNSNGAIINWQKFGIAAGETTKFIQTSASSRVLNQVVGAGSGAPIEMSKIYGTLSSNGQVWLVNPAGIMVGPGGIVDTAGFVASTLKVKPEDFLAGRLNFQATAGAGDVINQGTIKTPLGGSVYLVGTNVSNESVPGVDGSGIITTPGGETILAAGATVNLIDTATPGVKVEITGAANNATNLGTIVAEAGRIGIAGSIVRNSGTLDASSVTSEGGRIFLKASQDTYVDGSGRIVATGTKGGQVEVLGNRVAVMDNASIDASGANGGGTILVGGDYQGKNPDVQNAYISYFGPNASLKANATDNGNGGKVIVWADDTTRAYGTIEARGGANGGDGGFVETSGHRYLDYQGLTDTRAPHGETGMLLLDPTDITIQAGSGGTGGSIQYGGAFLASADSATIGWDTITAQLGSSSVYISTGSGYYGSGNITFSAGTTYSSGSSLTFNALGAGARILGNGVTIQNNGTGSINFLATGDITGSAMNVSSGGQIQFTSTGGNVLLGNGTISSAYGGSMAIYLAAPNGSVGIGHLNTTSTGGSIYVSARYSILDDNWTNPGEININSGGGQISLTSSQGVAPGQTCTDGCNAISVDISGSPSSIYAAVTGTTAPYGGGVGVNYFGSGNPSVSLYDNSTNNPANNFVEFHRENGNLTSGNFTSYGGVYLSASGDLDTTGISIIGSPWDIGFYAGGTLTVGSGGLSTTTPMGCPSCWPFLGLAAGTAINVTGPLNSAGDLALIAGVSKSLLNSTNFENINGPTDFYNLFSSANGTLTVAANLTASEDIGMMAGNIDINSGAVVTSYSTANGIMANAGSTMNVNGSMRAYGGYGGDIMLIAGSDINVSSTGRLWADYDLGLLAGGNININGGQVDTLYGSIGAGAGGDINVLSGGWLSAAGYNSGYLTADVALIANNINMNDGLIDAGGNVLAAVAGNITLSNYSQILAGDDVMLVLAGANSTLSLNPTAGMTPSYILSDYYTGVPATIYLDFLGRSSGGVVIDGVETTTSTPSGSGLFVLNETTPATPGYGLVLAYANTIDPCALSPELCKLPEPPVFNDPNIPLPTTPYTDERREPVVSYYGRDEFGGTEDGGTEKSDNKESNNVDNSDSKSKGKKKAAQCKG